MIAFLAKCINETQTHSRLYSPQSFFYMLLVSLYDK